MNNYHPLLPQKCRLCWSSNIAEVFKLNNCLIDWIYLDNPNTVVPKEDFTLMKCQNCWLIQLREIVDTSNIYTNYKFSSTNTRYILDWMSFLSGLLINRFWVKNKKILEIWASDWCFLKLFSNSNHVKWIEPSEILVKQAKEKYNLSIDNDFFWKDSYLWEKFDFIICRHVLEHIEMLNDVIMNICRLCDDHSLVYIEVPDNDSILDNLNYSSLFHEHINYFSKEILEKTFKDLWFEVKFIMENDICGWSFWILFKKLCIKNNYNDLLNKINVDCSKLSKILEQKKYNDITWYWAANKTFKLISNLWLEDKLSCIYDRNSNLENCYIPTKTGIKIKNPKEIIKDKPDCIILFATSYKDEIIKYLRNEINYKSDIISITPEITFL